MLAQSLSLAQLLALHLGVNVVEDIEDVPVLDDTLAWLGAGAERRSGDTVGAGEDGGGGGGEGGAREREDV